jgi:hypothetical protein
MDGGSIINSGSTGLRAGGSSCRVRNAQISGNLGGGIRIDSNSTTVYPDACDLGTAASPGGNTIDNPVYNLLVDSGAVDAPAVGNVWTPSQQGTDAQGRFSVAAGQTSLRIAGPITNSRNVRVTRTGASVLVAQ